MIFSIDDRPLSSDLNKAAYPSLSAVVNHRIAQKMGADYAYLSAWIDPAQVERLESTVGRRWRGNFSEKVPYDRSKRMYHPTLGLPRPLAWATVLVAWHLATTQAHKYDYILYLDTDVVLLSNITIEQLLAPKYKAVRWGADASKAGLVFFSNAPWGNELPCVGIYITSVRERGADMLRQWWDNEFLGGSFDFPPLQLGLWTVMGLRKSVTKLYNDWVRYEDRRERFRAYTWPEPKLLTNETVCVLAEKPFKGPEYQNEDGTPRWARHVGMYASASTRAAVFKARLQELGLADPSAFAAEIDHILSHHVTAPIDVQAIAHRMAERTQASSHNH